MKEKTMKNRHTWWALQNQQKLEKLLSPHTKTSFNQCCYTNGNYIKILTEDEQFNFYKAAIYKDNS